MFHKTIFFNNVITLFRFLGKLSKEADILPKVKKVEKAEKKEKRIKGQDDVSPSPSYQTIRTTSLM